MRKRTTFLHSSLPEVDLKYVAHAFTVTLRFYASLQAPWRVNDPQTAAQIMCMSADSFHAKHMVKPFLVSQWQLGLTNAAVFAAPIPAGYEAAGEKIQKAVEQAVAEAEEFGINSRGKAVTPWLLNRVVELTDRVSLANSAFVLSH